MRPQRSRRAILISALMSACQASSAYGDDGAPPVSISGFGTLGAVRHGSDGVEYRRDISQPNGAKAHRWNVDVDSMLGVQATLRPISNLEATVQLVTRHAIGVGYNPQVTWAYMKWKPREDITLRAGRLGIELYPQGDSAEIGYANLLVRQPIIVYPRTQEGFDAELTVPLGEGTARFKGMLGRTVGRLILGGSHYDTQGSRIWGTLAEYSWSGWTGRLVTGALKTRKEISGTDVDALNAALSMAPNGTEITSVLSMQNRRQRYTAAALSYDSGPLLGEASMAAISSPGWSTLHNIHVLVGRRVGDFIPYAAYSRQSMGRNIITTGIPWGFSAATDALNLASGQAQGINKTNQSIISLGVRRDITRNTAVKFQIDRIRYQEPDAIVDPSLSAGAFEQRSHKNLHLFSAALEFVF